MNKQPTNLNLPAHPLLLLVGATATGKTSLALKLAKQLNADLLSADSRQVYQGLEITSGADQPEGYEIQQDESLNSQFNNYLADSSTRIYGQSLLSPTETWSVGLFKQYTLSVIKQSLENGKRLIIVGGAGLYLHALLIADQNLNIQPNNQLRQTLQELTVEQLQTQLTDLQPQAKQMFNHSDWQNPTRLIRAIEMLSSNPNYIRKPIDQVKNLIEINIVEKPIYIEPVWFGLESSLEKIELNIQHRVEQRIKDGALREIENLIENFPNQKLPAFQTTGVKEITAFLHNQISQSELIELWTKRERQYAKRQLTWFKKRNYINWLNIDTMNQSQVIEQITSRILS